jgi:release factor glutamine methyltransferase
MTTISQWRQALSLRLKPVAEDLAAYETNCLLGSICACGPTELTLRAASELSPDQEQRLETFVQRRLSGLPLAYVLGRAHFYGLELASDSRALIPRPETEELVQIALDCLPQPSSDRWPLVIDIGTGSGNIALAMAHERPDLRVIATDIELPALALADENRTRLNLTDRISLVAGRGLSMFRRTRMIDMIVTNPPYIALGNPHVEQSVIDYEPHAAVFAGPSGLEIIIELLVDATPRLVPDGWLITEIGYDQGEIMRAGAGSLPEWQKPIFHCDLAGIERIMAIQRRA